MTMIDLIKEAYIYPIRSVMVVDDEYPTLSKLISNQDQSEDDDKKRLQNVVKLCREPENNWMLDVHDGDFDGTDDVDNLHHSDLLILDYHLEGNGDDGKGYKALEVLSTLANKDHFNLVVVHTKGYTNYNSNDGYKAVFQDIVFDFQTARSFPPIPRGMQKQAEEAIDAWELEHEGILDELVDLISDLDYLKLHNTNTRPAQLREEWKEFRELKARFESRPVDEDEDIKKLPFRALKWYILQKKGEKISAKFGAVDFDGLRWSDTEQCLWVKVGNLFVVVVGKDTSTSDLPDKLLEALQNWGPHPHRMLLAKLRHKLDEHGFSMANDLLDKKYTQAGWLRDMLYCEEHELEDKSWITTQNHLEELSWSYKAELSQFLANVVRCLVDHEGSPSNVEGLYSEASVLDDDFEIFKSVNAFNNAIPVDGKHLTTGHILQGENENLFLVVTPACDLVPGRSTHKRVEVVIQKLYPVTQSLRKTGDPKKIHPKVMLERCQELVNSKQLLFFFLNGEIQIYSTTSRPFNNANPGLVSVAVENDGVWGSSRELRAYNLDLSKTPPEIRTSMYTVVGQLRYEYALHHSKTSGEHVSRIGLDYVTG